MAAIGTAGAIGVTGSQLMGMNTHPNGETATYLALVIVGAPVWALSWRQAERRLDDDERRSLPRRGYLYLAVLEGAYEKIRSEERGLDLEHLDPPDAIERLIDFTWNYFLRNPEFLALLNTENLAKARHLKRSTKVKSMHSPFVEMIRTVVRRGVESGDFVVAVDPVQLYISIAALCFFYLSNSATLSVIFGRDLLSKDARDERLEHMVALVLAALTGKSSAIFARSEPRARAPAQQPADMKV